MRGVRNMADEKLTQVEAKGQLLDMVAETMGREMEREGVDTKALTALLMFFLIFAPQLPLGVREIDVRALLNRRMPLTLELADKYTEGEVT